MVANVNMEFKNKSIKEKVNGSFEMIIVLYVVSVAFAVFLMFAVKIVPSATEYFVLAGGIVVLAIITVCSILATLKRAKMLIHYIVEPVRELSSVAEKISGGELDIEIAYQSEDEIGELAEDFRKTATTLQRIIGDLNHILDAFAKGDYTVKSGCRDAYVGEFDTVHAKLIATTEHVSDALKSIRESSNQVAQGSDQLAVSAQDLAKNATDQAVAVDSLAQSVSEITEQILGTSKSIDIVHDKAKQVGVEAANSQKKMDELVDAMKKINITTIALLVYLIVMSIIGWPGNNSGNNYTEYFLMIGATLVIIILLRYLQVKRLRMRDKWNKDEDPAKQ